jgi:hypothetical protein
MKWRAIPHVLVFSLLVMPIGVRAVARAADSIWGVEQTDEGECLICWRIEGLGSSTTTH